MQLITRKSGEQLKKMTCLSDFAIMWCCCLHYR